MAEGKVSVQSRENTNDNTVILEHDQMSLVDGSGIPSEPEFANVSQHLGWMNHDIVFDNVPLREVISQIERWHDIRIRIDKREIAGKRISVHIQFSLY